MNESSINKKIKTILILAAILVMPGFLYYLLQDQGKNRYKPLPFFGPKTVANTFRSVRGKQIPDTIYHQVENFKLKNQNADSISLSDWKKKVVVINLFYTNAKSLGAKSALHDMQGFSKEYAKNDIVKLVSLSVDPNDTPTILKNFITSNDYNLARWDFLTGDATTVNELVKKSLLLDVVQTKVADDIKYIYGNKFVLLDSKSRIRGYYDAANKEEVSKLDDEIKVLIAEELRNIKDGR